MVEPPPRDPPEPEDETIVSDQWAPEDEVFVERTEEPIPPRRRPPLLWPGLLALLVLVLAGLAAAYFLTRDDDDQATATTGTTTQATTAAALVRVPDVVGTTSSEATATLRDAGFEVNLVPVPSDKPSGSVIAQNPPAGGEAPKDSVVRINVAQKATSTATTETGTTSTETTGTTTQATTPPEPATVPDAAGQELADAARAFADEGLKVAVRYVPSSEAAGRVVAQAQPAGTERTRGDTVQLNVSKGAEPATDASVPDVVGRRADQARRVLEQAGFEVLAVNLGQDEVRNEDTVGSQSPGAGASIPRGALVLLYVSG